MNVKQEHYIFGLIGVGALIVLYVLYMESQSAQPAPTAPPDLGGGGFQSYPSAPASIQLGNVYLGAPPNTATPATQSYNTPTGGVGALPQSQSVAVTDSGSGSGDDSCSCDSDGECDSAGVPVTQQKISSGLMTSVTNNLQSYLTKVSITPQTGVGAALAAAGGAPAVNRTTGQVSFATAA